MVTQENLGTHMSQMDCVYYFMYKQHVLYLVLQSYKKTASVNEYSVKNIFHDWLIACKIGCIKCDNNTSRYFGGEACILGTLLKENGC